MNPDDLARIVPGRIIDEADMDEMLAEASLRIGLYEIPSGDMAVKVYGPVDPRVLVALESVTKTYRLILAQAEKADAGKGN